MNPKKYTEIYKEISEDLDINQNFIADCVDFYYADLRSTLTELDYLNVIAPGLGYFKIKTNSIKKSIYKCKNTLKKKDTYTLKSYTYYKHKESLLDRLLKVKDKLDKEKVEKEKFKETKSSVKSKRNMEKQKTNS